MSETITVPRYASYRAQMKLERAEAAVDAFCKFYGDLVAALSIRRAWLRASA